MALSNVPAAASTVPAQVVVPPAPDSARPVALAPAPTMIRNAPPAMVAPTVLAHRTPAFPATFGAVIVAVPETVQPSLMTSVSFTPSPTSTVFVLKFSDVPAGRLMGSLYVPVPAWSTSPGFIAAVAVAKSG